MFSVSYVKPPHLLTSLTSGQENILKLGSLSCVLEFDRVTKLMDQIEKLHFGLQFKVLAPEDISGKERGWQWPIEGTSSNWCPLFYHELFSFVVVLPDRCT